MAYLVLIADIIGSRKLPNRGGIQKKLAAELDRLNATRSQLASPYTITLGDEFQAVFEGADRLFADLFSVMGALHPVELRFAISVGPLDTPINSREAIGMDGPAFHQARDLLERMKKRDRVIDLAGLPADDGLLDATLGLFNHQLRKWRANRLAVMQQLLCGRDVATIAGELDITEQSVYKNIRDGGLEAAIDLITTLTPRLNHALDDVD
ncbi:SatD family protein [Marinobacteraceae bacterium S3BR75-40.1]